ncbi:uncharacterized protein LOC126168908 [Schistocerca cancellata]|uniref:uncharacterized protein LOC126168908 n=1 Tax=Schistocerca cancellata TaxID=274614 RepID=UPI0021174158|nr:uncharacterized protein LOC126168908 [Schistocerca cancellata]
MLNDHMEANGTRPESIQDILRQFTGKIWLSNFDITTGFNQNVYNRVPFGLKDSGIHEGSECYDHPEMREFCVIYIDDIIVASATFEEYMWHIKQLLAVLQRYGVTLRPDKAKLCANRVEKCKLEEINENETALSRARIKTVLGADFCQFFADVESSIRAVEEGQKVELGKRGGKVFEKVKIAFHGSICLAHPDFTTSFQLSQTQVHKALGDVCNTKEFDMEIAYCQCKHNKFDDCLSRNPSREDDDEENVAHENS